MSGPDPAEHKPPARAGGTLIVTTKSGVRPLGVRGQPLHNAAAQLRRVVRRRLGDGAAGLLADPQLHEDGKAIDWYADYAGEVKRAVDMPAAERSAVLTVVDRELSAIGELGTTLAKVRGGEEDSGVVGRSLLLAARRPAESFVFLVGGKPVVVCWGYEKDAAQGLLPPSLPAAPRVQAHMPVLQAPPIAAAAPLAAAAVARPLPWLRTALLALPLLLLLLAGAWLLREILPENPALSLATREGPDAAAPPPAPPDRVPILKASLTQESARAKALQIEMDTIRGELKKRVADCKPPEPPPAPPKEAPKPPPQVAAVAPPPPAPRPAPAPQPPPRNPYDNRLRLPPGPTNDYSFMKGCWRTDPFRHETVQLQPGISSYCFNSSGYGQLEWRRGRTACRTSAQAHFNGNTLMLRDADTTCNDGSHWFADRLVCLRGAGDVAQCSGNSRGTYGPVSWTVNLHKLE
jgi:hypothetical protein